MKFHTNNPELAEDVYDDVDLIPAAPAADHVDGGLVIIDEDIDPEMDQDDAPETGAPSVPLSEQLRRRGAAGIDPAPVNRRTLRKMEKKKSSLGAKRRVMATAMGAEAVKTAKIADSVARNRGIMYSKVEGGRTLSDSRGMNARLRPSEVKALQTLFFDGAINQPKVHSFTDNSGTLEFDADQNLADGSKFFGGIISIEASNLNRVPGGELTLELYTRANDATGGTAAVTKTVELAKSKRVVTILDIAGLMIAGRTRLVSTDTDDSAASFISGYKIVGLPTGYSAKFRPLVPGDATAEDFLAIL